MKEGKEKKDGWKHDKFDGGGHSPPPTLEKKGRDSEVRRDEEYSRFIKEFEPEPPASTKYDDRKDKAKSDDYDKYDKYDKNHDKYDKNHDKYEKRHHHRDDSPGLGLSKCLLIPFSYFYVTTHSIFVYFVDYIRS